MSEWTHAICPTCFKLITNNDARKATRAMSNESPAHDICCWCGGTTDGIYYRHDPVRMPCGGKVGAVHIR